MSLINLIRGASDACFQGKGDNILNLRATGGLMYESDLAMESARASSVRMDMPISNIEEIRDYDEEDLIYPSLLEASDLMRDSVDGKYDPEWSSILYDAAYGKLPPGFTIRNDGITYVSGGKKQSVRPSNDPEIGSAEVIRFFRTAGGVRTSMDIEAEQAALTDARNRQELELNLLTWDKMKNAVRQEAIQYYIGKQVIKHNLNNQQRLQLKTTVNMGLCTGAIHDSDVTVVRGSIDNIRSIVYEGGRFVLTAAARERVRMPVVKDTCPDDVYFDRYGRLADAPNRKFSGFLGEWTKFNQKIQKSISNGCSGRSDSISVDEWTDDLIESMKPTKFALNPNNVLLSPRPFTSRELSNSARNFIAPAIEMPSSSSTTTFTFTFS